MTTVREVRAHDGESPLTMLTAYDATTARFVDEAGVDLILVGDSLGRTELGYDTTLPVTVEDVASRVGAVVRGAENAVVVADMPFLSIGVDEAASIRHCGQMLKEEGAQAIKLECGPHTVELTERLVDLGIPVMAHLGLTPQHVNRTGRVQQGTDREAATEILDLAREHEAAGAFALVLEHVPENLAAQVTEALAIPTIGIGAGAATDGQVLVVNDVLGLTESPPPFAKAFGDVASEMRSALSGYVDAVESGEFPGEEHARSVDGLEDLD